MARWFLIGFIVLVALAIAITVLLARDLEAGMLYLVDFPTIGCLDLVDRFFSSGMAKQLSGHHPYYVPFNVLGSVIWGLLFMLAAFAVSLIKGRKHFA